MLGRYTPAKVPTIELMDQNGFAAQIREINREKGTLYSLISFIMLQNYGTLLICG